MEINELNRVAVPLSLAVFFALGMVWPSLRLARRHGVRAVVLHKPANPFQRVVGVGMALFMVGALGWGVLCATVEPGHLAIWTAPVSVVWMGWSVTALGFALVVAAQAQMGSSWRIGIDTDPTDLVTHGLFRWVRNPIFTGMFLALLGLALATLSPWTVMALLDYALLVSLQVRLEEQHLAALHGSAYRSYAARVGRFVPALGRLP